jgi:hypothetical protein
MVETQAHPTGSTGNSSAVVQHTDGMGDNIAIDFTVEAVGATPTVSWIVEGSLDGVTWNTVPLLVSNTATAGSTAVVVQTTVGKQQRWLDGLIVRFYTSFRVTTTLNTNVTYSSRLLTPASASA